MNDAEKFNLPPIEGYDDPLWDDDENDRHYDRSGNPISMRDWMRLRHWDQLVNGGKYTIVKQETIGDYFVSTVWIGLNHNFMGHPPLIFETMVFRNSTGETDLECQRYATEAVALKGHERIAAQARAIAELEKK